MSEKTAGLVEIGDVLVVLDAGEEQHEEVLFTAWASDGDVLIWTDECELEEPIRMDESALLQVMEPE